MVPRSLDGILSGKAEEFVNILDHKEAPKNTLSFTVSVYGYLHTNVHAQALTSHWSFNKINRCHCLVGHRILYNLSSIKGRGRGGVTVMRNV